MDLKYTIQEWVALTSKEVRALEIPKLSDKLILTFPDKSTVTLPARMAKVTHPFLKGHRLFNIVPSLEMFLDDKEWFTPGKARQLVNRAIKEILAKETQLLASDLGGLALEIATDVINASLDRIEYCTTIDPEDYHQIENDAEIQRVKREAIRLVEETVSGAERYRQIVHVHNTLESRLKEGYADEFHYNMLSILISCGALKLPQLKQAILRGYVTDINSEFGVNPIMAGIYTGLRTPYEAYMESLSGAKASFFTKQPVQDTEYTNRQMQLIGGYLKNLHPGDCGSKITYRWIIKDKRELSRFEGKNMVCKDGSLHEITEDDTHLIGQAVNVRHPAGCIHPDKVGICTTCVGGVSRSIPYNVMTGVGLITELFAQITQKVISVKHDDTSTVGKTFPIPETLKGIIKVAPDGRTITPDTRKGKRGLNLALASSEVSHLDEIELFDNLDDLNPNRISNIDDIIIWWYDKEFGEVYESLRVSNGKTKGKLSREFLQFLKMNPSIRTTTKIGKTTVVNIDFDNIPMDMPVINLPFKHTSMLDIHRKVDLFFLSSAEKDKEEGKEWKYDPNTDPFLINQTSFAGAIHAFNDLIEDKFTINQAVLECSIYPFTVRSKADGDWNMVKGTNACEFGALEEIIAARSLSVHTIHQRHYRIYQEPTNYTNRNKVEHTYDANYCSVS